MNILVHTSFIGPTGYNNHARSFFCALNKYHTVKVRNFTIGETWKGMSNTPHDNEPYITQEMKDMLILQTLHNSDGGRGDYPMYNYKGDFKPDVHIILNESDHYYFYEEYEGYKIGYCVYESTRFPEHFFKRLFYFDEMWVPTQWQFDSLVEQGYPKERIRIVPEGVDVDIFKPKERIKKRNKFRFLLFGRWDYRKSTTEIIRAFGETFKGNNNVELLCSVENPFPYDGLKSTEERIKKNDLEYKNVKYVKFPKRSDYINYLQEGEVFVSCARSEGWNLPLIEAMSCGTPSIYSNWGAQLQFAKNKGIPVKISHLRPANICDKQVEGEYCEPDFEDLSKQMKAVYENYEIYKINALKESEVIHREFNWDKVVIDASNLLENISKKLSISTIFKDDIFVIGEYANTEDKEKTLISLINKLKRFNIPILLSGHYPVNIEIQKMVDFYLFDKENVVLSYQDYENYSISPPVFYVSTDEWKIDIKYNSADYATWSLKRNAVTFAKYLGKKNIHYMDYDNNPDAIQYLNEFLIPMRQYDAVMWDVEGEERYETFMYSIKTDIALKIFNDIKCKEEYYNGSNMLIENVIFRYLNKLTNKIYKTKYVPIGNDLTLHTHIFNKILSYFLVCDNDERLYIAFHMNIDTNEFAVTIDYNGTKKEHVLNNGKKINTKQYSYKMFILDIGKYKMGETVHIFYNGADVSNTALDMEYENYKKYNTITFYKKTQIMNNKQERLKDININFIDGPFVEVKEDTKKSYHIEFKNLKNNNIEFEHDMESNHWCKASKKYNIDWSIKIKGINTNYYFEHKFDVTNRRVLISFESKALGDTLAWFPYVEKFRIDKKCEIVCSTFHNYLFQDQYPEIQFIEPGSPVNNIYALYRVGVFINNGEFDVFKHPTDPRTEPLTKIASDILGLDYIELRPNLPIISDKKKEKLVSIAIHSTAQCKYWNNPNGWQDVVDFLKENGYEVLLLSKEQDGYMGNKTPKGVKRAVAPTISDALKIIQESKLFIGISSGLSWLSWAAGTDTILISGFTDVFMEPMNGIRRVINEDVCHGCWSKYNFNPGDWNWCPVHKGTDRQFECSKAITSEQVIKEIKEALNL